MNKRFLIAWVLVFIVWMIGGYLVHGALLRADYAQLSNLYRAPAEAQEHMTVFVLARIIMAGAFVWIYSRGVEARGWVPQGLRFGLAVALLTIVPTYMIYYVVQPVPGMHVVRQIVFDGLLVLLLGVVVAFMYRQPSAARVSV